MMKMTTMVMVHVDMVPVEYHGVGGLSWYQWLVDYPAHAVTVLLQMDLLLSQDLLQQHVSLEQLPPALDGFYPYSHEEWVRFRMVSGAVLYSQRHCLAAGDI